MDAAPPVALTERDDIAEHEGRAAGFWLFLTVLVTVLELAAPDGAPLWSAGGLATAGVIAAANVLYSARIAFGEPRSDLERLLAVSAVTLLLGVQQWLVGYETPLMLVVLPVYVLGGVAVLGRDRLPILLAAVAVSCLSGLLYVPLQPATVAFVVAFLVVLLLQAGLLADFGERVRAQRAQLAAAGAAASRRALTDELTGLANRRALAAYLHEATAWPALTALYVDLDGFKPFNDAFGHAAGDALLSRLAGRLRDAVQGSGQAFRMGGDEFCVVLPADIEGSAPLVARLVDCLAEVGAGYAISASFGVAAAPVDSAEPEGVLRVADQRMYVQKQQHRAAALREPAR